MRDDQHVDLRMLLERDGVVVDREGRRELRVEADRVVLVDRPARGEVIGIVHSQFFQKRDGRFARHVDDREYVELRENDGDVVHAGVIGGFDPFFQSDAERVFDVAERTRAGKVEREEFHLGFHAVFSRSRCGPIG